MPKIVAPPEIKPKTEPIITTCPNCHYTISYTEDEIEHVDNESMGIYCPHCGGVIETEHVEPFIFPKTFFHYSEDEGAACLTNEQVQKYIDDIKQQLLKELKVGEYTFSCSGDTIVFGFKMENQDMIIVANNYWEDSVFYEV